MLVTSIFSFFQNVFYPVKDRNHHLNYIQFVIYTWFQFGQVIFCCLVELNLSQISLGFYMFAVQVFRKQCGIRRNCSFQAISPYPTVFSTHLKNFLPFSSNLELSSAYSSNFEEYKIFLYGGGSRIGRSHACFMLHRTKMFTVTLPFSKLCLLQLTKQENDKYLCKE